MNDYYSGDDEDYDLNTAPHQPAPNVTATVDPQVALRTAVVRGRRDIASTIVSAERNFSYQTKSYKEQIESEVRTAVRSAQFYESVYQTGRHIVNMQPTVIKSFDERQSAPHHQLSGLLKFTPDGLLCYVNSVRRAIMGVNVQTGEEFPLVETPTTIYCLAIEGEYIAVGGSARCQIWRLSPHGPAKLVHELMGLVTIVNSVCFYRYNGQLRLIVNHNEPRESMMVYSVDTGKELFRKTVPEPQGTRINYCAIHPDGQLVLVGGDLHALFLLRTAADTFTIIQRLASPVGDVHMCAWSPDGRFGAGASDGRFAPATDPRVGSDVCLVERVAEEIRSVPVPDIAGTQPPVRNVCFSPSGLVAFVHGNTQVRVMRPDHPEYSDVFTPAAPTHGYLSLLGATWDQHDTLYVCTGEAIFAYTAYTIPTLIDLCVHTLRSRPNRWRHLVLPAEVAERLTAEAPWESNKRRQLERILRSAQRNREGAQRDHERLYERSVQRYQEAARAAEAAGVELSKEPLPPPYTYPPFISDEVLAAPPPS